MSNTPRTDGILRWIIFACKTPDQLDAMAEHACELERENAALMEEVVEANGLLDMRMKELAKLREDKERLDWILTDQGGSWVYWQNEICEWEPSEKASRSAIDAARKEAKP